MMDDKKREKIPLPRLALWIVVGAVGAYTLISGIIGIIAKG